MASVDDNTGGGDMIQSPLVVKRQLKTERELITMPNLSEQIKNVLNEHLHQGRAEESCIEMLIGAWGENKETLIDTLRKHPNWNEKALAVVMTIEDNRPVNYGKARDIISEIVEKAIAEGKAIDDEIIKQINELRGYPKQFIDINKKIQLKAKNLKVNEGQKVSRVLNSLFKKAGFHNLPEYNKLYAKLADAYNPLTIKRKSLLSVHPCDYLTMAHGNGWSSCQGLQDGCHKAGTLSYMLDSVSMIFYTLKDDYEGEEWHNEPKITRNVICYQNNVIMQSTLYPSDNEEKKTQYREIMQSIFAECEKVDNLWIKKSCDSVSDYVMTARRALHYTDYERNCSGANVSILKGFEPIEKMTVGASTFCLSCGDGIEHNDSLFCRYCYSPHTCENCGDGLDEDDGYWAGDYMYCYSCINECVECDEYHLNGEMTETADGMVCESCLSDYYYCCDDCGEYHHHDDIRYLEGLDIYVCDDCTENYNECEECGNWFEYELDENYRCESCRPEEEEDDD